MFMFSIHKSANGCKSKYLIIFVYKTLLSMKNAIGIVLSFIFFVSACSANGNQSSKNQTNMIN